MQAVDYWLSTLKNYEQDATDATDAYKKNSFELLAPIVRCALMDNIIRRPLREMHQDPKQAITRQVEVALIEALLKLREMHQTTKTHYGGPLGNEPHNLIRDFEYAIELYESSHCRLREDLAYNASLVSLEGPGRRLSS
jgi:hypothetical protein